MFKKKIFKKALLVLMAIGLLAGTTQFSTVTSYAATTIDGISLTFDTSDIVVGGTDKYIDVTSDNDDEYTVSNERGTATNMPSSGWKSSSTPRFTITIKRVSGYAFDTDELEDSDYYDFNGDDVTFVSASGSSTSITLTVKMTSIDDSDSDYDLDVSDLEWDEDTGEASWTAADDASKYYVKLYRGSSLVHSDSTTDTEYDFSSYITTTGTYTFRVRAYYSGDYGDWEVSDSFKVTSSILSDIEDYASSSSKSSTSSSSSSGPGVSTSTGAWLKDDTGWWYCNADKSYTVNNWQYINSKWYFFNESGYMVTGWVYWNSKWYYCGSDGAMLVSTTTPDGYTVDSSGAWVQ